MHAVIIFILILAVLLVIFTLQNSIEITINVFFWEIVNAPLVLVLIVCIIAGYLIAAFYFYPRIWKIRRENKQLVKSNKELSNLNESYTAQKTTNTEDDNNPEGIKMDDDKPHSFFDF